MIFRRVPTYLLLTLIFVFKLSAQEADPLQAPDQAAQQKWVDSTYASMNLQEKVGQLFMVDVFSNAPKEETDKIKKLIDEQHIGGIIFSKGGPVRQAQLTNEFQEQSKIPLLIGMDAEWGLGMRLDSTFVYPWNMTLGAIQNENLIRETGASISRHAKRLGVQLNFAPVVDINTNPDNPIIGNRSFGEEKGNVALKSAAFLEGMQQENMLATAKHFPGHGDTETDSHKTLPTINFPKNRIFDLELFPYRKLIPRGLSGVMVGHLNVPSLSEKEGLPSSLSKNIVDGILKIGLNFKGLIFTDALRMNGVADYKETESTEVAAFLAGNDVLLMPEDVAKASEELVAAYHDNTITEKRLSESVKKILKAKYKVNLESFQPIDTTSLYQDLNTVQDSVLFEGLMEKAVTVIRNNSAVVPVQHLENKQIAYVNFGNADGSPFLEQMRKYADVDWVRSETLPGLLQKLQEYNYVVIGFHKPNNSPWDSYKFSERELTWIQEIARNNKTVLSIFASPYALLDLKTTSNFEGIIIGYQNHPVAQQKVAQVIFGGIGASGKLPVSIGAEYPAGTGYNTQSLQRLAYGLPESVGLNSEKLKKIDTIIQSAIEGHMTPGVQLLIARRGKVIYQKNMGYYTYDERKPVTDTSLYDLASVTKILATLPLIMEQVEQGVINFDTTLSELIPAFKGSNKGDIRLQDMLMHYARLKPWIPFYVPTMDRKTHKLLHDYYRKTPEENYDQEVANGMYIRNDIEDSIVNIIRDSDLERKKEYKYSDLPFYLLKYYLEHYYHKDLNELTQERFYKSLGAYHTGYLPWKRFSMDQIVPTEIDKLWRRQEVQGFVNDQGAAMLGGIGGHAGLFSNANDIAKIMQMYLNGGSYGGEQYFKPETISKFNTCYYCDEDVRRGVGFDKPQLEKVGPTCNCVSMSSFGHTGFTGTLVWADPEERIVYVFLSNRTFPDPNNRKLIHEDIRSRIQEVIYESIEN
ncbi:MAG: glycoside hydrolase family 3 N-terminal domain-containing protein [Salegentibacter sp.]